MKHIGILAHSFEGATLCFRTACLEGVKRLGPHMHPEITMTCSPMALVLDAWDRGDNAKLRGFFMEDAKKLAAAGCDFFNGNYPDPAQFGLAVSGFASTPYNVAIGGTDFNDPFNPLTYWNMSNTSATLESAKGYIPEVPWNDS